MEQISETAEDDPVETITVEENKAPEKKEDEKKTPGAK
jgi:hypothetical protein